MKKAVMYLNQFFGQIGGEDKADFAPIVVDKLVGPAMQLDSVLDATVTHTVICGDNFMGSNTEEAIDTIIKELRNIEFDIFVAGPAFQAGRYGVACGHICNAVKKEFNIPVITSMHVENPGVEMFKKDMYIMIGGNSAAKMKKDIEALSKLANKILNGEQILGPQAEGYYERGIRHQVWLESNIPAADRVVDMFLKKINDQEYVSELPIPKLDRVPIAPAVKDLSKAKIALVNTGGIVPVDNPDKIQSASATRWGRYDISNMDDLKGGVFKTIHAGFDPAAADADPDVITPIDALRAYEKEGKYGSLHNYFYTTVGTGTTQAEAQRMAKEIIPFLREDNVNAIIMVST